MKIRWLWAAVSALLVFTGCRHEPGQRAGTEADQTRPAAEWLKLEPVRLLREYVSLDTREEVGEEQGAEFFKRLFDCAGIENKIVCPLQKRCNLLARLPGRSREGALLLLNHIDVAPVFPASWKESAPFEGKIKLGYLYGRGAYDMKSLGLAQALAMRFLKENGIVPASDILFLAEADEEYGRKWGSAWLLEHRPEWFQGVSVVLNEGGTNEMILRDVRYWGIETVLAGYGYLEFESRRKEALKELSDRWPKLESAVVEPLPDVVRGFDLLANHLTNPLTDPLRHLDRVRRNPAELAILPDRYGAFLQARISWSPYFPYPPGATENFRAYVMVSTPPGMSPDGFLDTIQEDARRAGIPAVHRFSTGITTASPYQTPSGQLVPFVELIKKVTEARHPGVPFGPVPGSGGATTSVDFRQRHIAAYGYSPLAMNITDSVRRHGNDERIYLRDYLDGVDTYRDLLLEFAFSDVKMLSPYDRQN